MDTYRYHKSPNLTVVEEDGNTFIGAMQLEHAIVTRFVEHVKQEVFPEAIQEAIHKFSFR
jgi:hypothetical protein